MIIPTTKTDHTDEYIQAGMNAVSQMTRCKSTAGLTELLLESLEPFGISTYAMWAAVNPEREDPLASMLSNWPEEWKDIYMSERRYLIDPIVAEVVKKPGHFFWREIEVAPNSEASELFAEARQYGMFDGFTMSSRAQWPVVTALSLSG